MNIQFTGPVLFVKDIDQSRKFYEDILEQKIKHDFGTNLMFKSGLSLWIPSKGHEISHKHPYNINDNSRFELYFESDYLESIQIKLDKYGANYLHKIKEESWGQKTLRFYDPDNHLIEVGETLKAFVARMFNNGMSKKEIEKKTGIPIKDIEEIIG